MKCIGAYEAFEGGAAFTDGSSALIACYPNVISSPASFTVP